MQVTRQRPESCVRIQSANSRDRQAYDFQKGEGPTHCIS